MRFVKDLLDDPFLEPILHPPPRRDPRRGEISGAEALRDAPDDSENYHVSAGYYPPGTDGRRRRRRKNEGGRGGRGPRRGRSRRDVGPGMSPVIEETSSPSAKEKEAVGARGSDAGSRGSDAPPAEFARRSRSDDESDAREAAARALAARAGNPASRGRAPVAAPETDLESLYGGAESVWTEGERMWEDASVDEQAWVRALNGARGCLLYTSPSPRDATLSRMPSSA